MNEIIHCITLSVEKELSKKKHQLNRDDLF